MQLTSPDTLSIFTVRTVMAMKKVGFVTYRDFSQLLDCDLPVVKHLNERGIEVSSVSWDEEGVDWRAFDLVVLRSPWNYHRRIAEFREWLTRIEGLKVPLCNPAHVVLWNSDKRYLLELKEKGYPVVPTRVLDAKQLAETEISDLFLEWPEAVVKPSVSAASFETYRFNSSSNRAEVQTALQRIVAHSHVLIQPFLAQVAEGEISLVVIGGRFSHAVKKQPATGEFRVQKSFGGTCYSYTPTPSLSSFAEEAVRELGQELGSLLYARIDGVMNGGEFLIMEVELIEPYLFLEYSQSSYHTFSESIISALEAER